MYLETPTLDISYHTVSVALLNPNVFYISFILPRQFFIGDVAANSWYLSLFLLLMVAHHRIALSGFFVHHLKETYTFVLALNL